MVAFSEYWSQDLPLCRVPSTGRSGSTAVVFERCISTPCSVMFTWPDIYMYDSRERHTGGRRSQWPTAWMDTDRAESKGASAPRRTHASRIGAALRSLMML